MLILSSFVFATGGMFENEHIGPRLALVHALDEINLMHDILTHAIVIYEMQDVKPHDSFEANKKGNYMYSPQ